MAGQGSCARADFSEIWNGRVRGRLLDHRGRPAAGVSISIRGAQREVPDVKTDAAGAYQLEGVPAGTFVVGVSLPERGGPSAVQPIQTTYYPGVASAGAARQIRIAPGGLAERIDFKLPPPLPVHPVTLEVYVGNAPAQGRVEVTQLGTERQLAVEVPGPDGRVVVRAPAGPIAWKVCVASSAWPCAEVKRLVDRPTEIVIALPQP